MVRCNDIHLAKVCQYAVLSLVGPSSSFRIESHIGRDNVGVEGDDTLGMEEGLEPLDPRALHD